MADLATINDTLQKTNNILKTSGEGSATQQAKQAEQDTERKVYDSQVLAALHDISETIKGLPTFKIEAAESSGLLKTILTALGLGVAAAAGLATGLLIGWTTFVGKLLLDLGALVGKGIKKLSPQWLKDFMKAFTKDGKLYKNTMQYIDDFKTPKWLKNIMKAFSKNGKLYKNTMQYIDDFKVPKWLKNFGKNFGNSKIVGWFKSIKDFFVSKPTKLLDIKTMKPLIVDSPFVQWLKKIKKFFTTDMFKKVGKLVDGVGDFFKNAFPRSFGQIADSVTDIKKALPGAKGGVITKLVNGIKNIFTPLTDMWKNVKSFFAPLTKLFGGGKGGGKVGGILLKILTPLSTVFGAMKTFGKFLAGPLTLIMALFDAGFEAKDAIDKSEGFFAGLLNMIIGALGGFLDGAIMQMADMIKSGISWIAGFFGFTEMEKFLDSFSFSEMFNEFLDGIYGFVNAMFKWETYVKLFDDAVSYITGTGEGSLLGSIKALMSGISDWFMGLFDFSSMSGVIASTINILFMPYTILYDLVTGIWNWFGELFGFDMSDTDKAGEKATSAGGIGGMLVNLVAGVWDWFGGLFSWGSDKEPAEQEKGGILSYLTDMVTGVWTWIKGLFANPVEGLVTLLATLAGGYTTILDFISAPLKKGIAWILRLFGWDEAAEKTETFSFKTTIMNAFDAAVAWVTGLFAWGKKAGATDTEGGWSLSTFIYGPDGVINKAKEWVKDLFKWSTEESEEDSWLVTTIKDVIKTVKEWFGKIFDFKFEDIAKSIMPGFMYDYFFGGKELKAAEDAIPTVKVTPLELPDLGRLTDQLIGMFSGVVDSIVSLIPGFEAVTDASKYWDASDVLKKQVDTAALTKQVANMNESQLAELMASFDKERKSMTGGLENEAAVMQIMAARQEALKVKGVAEGGLVGMSPFAKGSLGKAMGLESGGLFTLSQGEFVLDNQAAQTFLKAAQLLAGSRAIEQAKGSGGSPVIINNNNIDNSQSNSSRQVTHFRMPETVRSRVDLYE